MATNILVASRKTNSMDWLHQQLIKPSVISKHPTIIVLATAEQARSMQYRMKEQGGLFHMHLFPLSQFVGFLQRELDCHIRQLSNSKQQAYVQTAIKHMQDKAMLNHFRPIAASHGFVTRINRTITELRATGVSSETFLNNVFTPRLIEIGLIYHQYEQLLSTTNATDFYGTITAIHSVLEKSAASLPNYPHIIFDGFDHFQPILLDLIAILAKRLNNVTVLMIDEVPVESPRIACRLTNQIIQELENRLNTAASPLPNSTYRIQCHPSIKQLSETFFNRRPKSIVNDDVVVMQEAVNRAHEVEVALRWLKRQIINNSWHPAEVALVTNRLSPYLSAITSTARSFGIPLRITDGIPLLQSTVVQAVHQWLDAVQPDRNGEPILLGEGLIEWLRSPFFDFKEALNISAEDMQQLKQIVYKQQIQQGKKQWDTAFAKVDDDFWLYTFDQIVKTYCPIDEATAAEWAIWVLERIGSDEPVEQQSDISLCVFDCIRRDKVTAAYEHAALTRWITVINQLETQSGEPISFDVFLNAVEQAVKATTFTLLGDGVLVAENKHLHGTSLKALAVIGMAEGEFPYKNSEPTLLNDSDRWQLYQAGLPIRLSQNSNREQFYELITCPSDALLLTRPCFNKSGPNVASLTILARNTPPDKYYTIRCHT